MSVSAGPGGLLAVDSSHCKPSGTQIPAGGSPRERDKNNALLREQAKSKKRIQINLRSSVLYTHDATRLVYHDEITFAVLVKYLDGFRRDRRLVTMNNIFHAIPVPHDRVRLSNLAIDSSDARLERVSLQNSAAAASPPSADLLSNRQKIEIANKNKKTTHNTRSSDPGIQSRRSQVSPG